ncbi:MAG: hypothetical protein WBL87_00540 [Methanothrix sp.]
MLLPCRLDGQEMLQNRAAERSRDGDQGAFLRETGRTGPPVGSRRCWDESRGSGEGQHSIDWKIALFPPWSNL